MAQRLLDMKQHQGRVAVSKETRRFGGTASEDAAQDGVGDEDEAARPTMRKPVGGALVRNYIVRLSLNETFC